MPDPTHAAIAVVICSHNPRLDYLQRTLTGLRAQSLPVTEWEFVLIDNASAEPITARVDLAWHPGARCVVESALGLTNARLRGIAETTAAVLVFVDDDNVLAPDYLATALEVGRSHPFLGAWGGRITGVYEIPPPDFCVRHAPMLAIRDVPRDLWSNTTEDFLAAPCGAGMCIRRTVAEAWIGDVRSRPDALKLGRIGKNLGACEDGHLALLSVRLGLGTGVFRRLALDHLIPRERLTLEYFTRLAAGHAYSYNLLRRLLGQPLLTNEQSGFERLVTRLRRWRATPAERAIELAMEQARANSLRDLTGLDA
jgi:glycosyltransferase involved in cell wall biosynthesis